jgi:uncharacterized protein (DUF58 family)
MASRKTVPEGIRITKVGLWFIILTILVAIPAANTGNNALYLVEATMLSLLVVSGIISRQNLRRLEVDLSPPSEVYANLPFQIGFELRNRGLLWPRWLLTLTVSEGMKTVLVPHVPRRSACQGHLELTATRRGRLHLDNAHLASIFPLGLFRKGMRLRVDLEVLVYPEIRASMDSRERGLGGVGEQPARKAGVGPELYGLRTFRQGDDRRGIHWKQTARTGEMIFMEREAEAGERLSIVVDNAVGELKDPAAEESFESLISEAATVAHHHLEGGYEVELVTRNEVVGFGRGRRHRARILEALALVPAIAERPNPLAGSDPSTPVLRFDLRGRSA